MDPWLVIFLATLAIAFIWGVSFGDDNDLDPPSHGKKPH